MGMTITEKILAAHSSKAMVKPGDLIFCTIDLVLSLDIGTASAIKIFERMGASRVFDPEKVVMVNDHFVPAKDIEAAELSRKMRLFARDQKLPYYFEVGRAGICHLLLMEKGLVRPGQVVVGGDSHTCTAGAVGAFAVGVGASDLAASLALGKNWFRVPETIRIVFSGRLPDWTSGKDLILLVLKQLGIEGARYKALEFGGETIESLPMADRITICNMAGETGAKNAIIEPDQVTCEFLKERGIDATDIIKSDEDAAYASVFEFRIDDLEPLVAIPSLPSNVKRVREVEGVKLDQVFIGSCTNGSLEDFRRAARLLDGRKVHESVRLIAIPGTPKILTRMIDEGIAKTFLEAGAVLGPCTCGPCLGGHMGVLAADEVALSTSNRNFVGRMGHPTSQLYLASPVVAAASAVLGRIADPRELGEAK
jgi:3-isopropylmalate/(R)-2-methylmalate dehydratase large subunit